MFLNEWAGGDLYPEELRGEIDELNEWIYSEFQNGVYRAGFSRTQEAYDEAFRGVFAAMERLEALLSDRRYLAGDRVTLAPTGGCCPRCCASTPSTTPSRCNGSKLVEHPNLLRYATDLYQQPHVAGDVRARRDQAPLLHDP